MCANRRNLVGGGLLLWSLTFHEGRLPLQGCYYECCYYRINSSNCTGIGLQNIISIFNSQFISVLFGLQEKLFVIGKPLSTDTCLLCALFWCRGGHSIYPKRKKFVNQIANYSIPVVIIIITVINRTWNCGTWLGYQRMSQGSTIDTREEPSIELEQVTPSDQSSPGHLIIIFTWYKASQHEFHPTFSSLEPSPNKWEPKSFTSAHPD